MRIRSFATVAIPPIVFGVLFGRRLAVVGGHFLRHPAVRHPAAVRTSRERVPGADPPRCPQSVLRHGHQRSGRSAVRDGAGLRHRASCESGSGSCLQRARPPRSRSPSTRSRSSCSCRCSSTCTRRRARCRGRLMVTLIVFFIVLVNVAKGLRQVHPIHVELLRSYAASPIEVLRKARSRTRFRTCSPHSRSQPRPRSSRPSSPSTSAATRTAWATASLRTWPSPRMPSRGRTSSALAWSV